MLLATTGGQPKNQRMKTMPLGTSTTFSQVKELLETAFKEANQDPSMVTQEFFPLEHLLAVYCPLILPLVLPFLFGVREAYARQWKRYRGDPCSDSEDEKEKEE